MKHEIGTIQDIANVVNPDNIESFMIDLTVIILAYQLTKKSCPDVKLDKFTWIDDGKHEISITVTGKK